VFQKAIENPIGNKDDQQTSINIGQKETADPHQTSETMIVWKQTEMRQAQDNIKSNLKMGFTDGAKDEEGR